MSDPDALERRRFVRDNARPGRQLPVRVRQGSGPWTQAETRNIGIGGAFIVLPTLPATGTEIVVELHLPDTVRRFELNAFVRWRGDGGVGVQFAGVDIDVLLELNDYFGSLPTTLPPDGA